MTYISRITLTIIRNVQTYIRRSNELNQHDLVCRLMFVALNISIDKAGKALPERLQIRVLSLSKKELLRVKAWYILLLTGQLSYIMVIFVW